MGNFKVEIGIILYNFKVGVGEGWVIFIFVGWVYKSIFIFFYYFWVFEWV